MENPLQQLEALLNMPGADSIYSPLTKLYVLLEEQESTLDSIANLVDVAVKNPAITVGTIYTIKHYLAEQKNLTNAILQSD